MEWSNATTLEFIELYREEPVIWNPKEPLHKNRNEVIDAWDRIKDKMSMESPVTELKRKKESLMSAFRHHQNKVNRGIESGKEYRPGWFAYKSMASFLRDIYQPQGKIVKPEKIHLSIEHDSADYEEDSLHNSVKVDEDDEDDEDEEDQDEDHKSEIKPNTIFIKESPKFLSHSASRKREIGINQTSVLEAPLKIRRTCASAHEICVNPTKDECSIYTELLSIKLRAFDERTRDVLMHEIDNLIFQAKIQKLKQQPPNP